LSVLLKMFLDDTSLILGQLNFIPSFRKQYILMDDNLEKRACSETMLTGESRFTHKYPPGGSLMTESKWVVHWTSETCWEWSEIADSPQGSPPAADSVGCEAVRETCSERETGTGKLCEIKWDYNIVGRRA
jgi:hypothetical protein